MLDAKALVFGFSRLWNLELVWDNKISCMKAVDSNQTLKTINLLVVDDPVGVVATALQAERKVFWLVNSELPPIPGQIEFRVESKR